MESKLIDFLVGVACDADLMAGFMADRGGQLQAAGLTMDEQAALMSRDSRRVLDALAAAGFAVGDVSHKGPKGPGKPGKPKPPGKPGKPGRKAPGKKRPGSKKR